LLKTARSSSSEHFSSDEEEIKPQGSPSDQKTKKSGIDAKKLTYEDVDQDDQKASHISSDEETTPKKAKPSPKAKKVKEPKVPKVY